MIRGGCFSGKDIHSRYPVGIRRGFDPVITCNNVEHIHELPLVLVDAFHLHIKQRIRIHHHAIVGGNMVRQPLLIFTFRTMHSLIHRRIIYKLLQLAQLH